MLLCYYYAALTVCWEVTLKYNIFITSLQRNIKYTLLHQIVNAVMEIKTKETTNNYKELKETSTMCEVINTESMEVLLKIKHNLDKMEVTINRIKKQHELHPTIYPCIDEEVSYQNNYDRTLFLLVDIHLIVYFKLIFFII